MYKKIERFVEVIRDGDKTIFRTDLRDWQEKGNKNNDNCVYDMGKVETNISPNNVTIEDEMLYRIEIPWDFTGRIIVNGYWYKSDDSLERPRNWFAYFRIFNGEIMLSLFVKENDDEKAYNKKYKHYRGLIFNEKVDMFGENGIFEHVANTFVIDSAAQNFFENVPLDVDGLVVNIDLKKYMEMNGNLTELPYFFGVLSKYTERFGYLVYLHKTSKDEWLQEIK